MSSRWVIVTFELKDGRELRCEYVYSYDLGGYWSPPEYDVGEPQFFLDDVEIVVEDMPKGLDRIAAHMYENGDSDKRFKYHSEDAAASFDDDPYFDY